MPAEPDAVLAELDRLAEPCRRADEAALARVYELTADLLASVAYRLTHDPHATDDVVQETFVRFVSAVPTIRGDGRALRAWLVRTTRNLCIDQWRSRSRRGEVLVAETPEKEPLQVDPLGDLPDPRLEVALARLTPDQRTALVLRYVGGLSGQELALAFDRNRAAIYTLLRRAERSLRRLLEEAPSDE